MVIICCLEDEVHHHLRNENKVNQCGKNTGPTIEIEPKTEKYRNEQKMNPAKENILCKYFLCPFTDLCTSFVHAYTVVPHIFPATHYRTIFSGPVGGINDLFFLLRVLIHVIPMMPNIVMKNPRIGSDTGLKTHDTI